MVVMAARHEATFLDFAPLVSWSSVESWMLVVDLLSNTRSSLSIAYYSPGWPLTAFRNGIVTAVATLMPALQAMGHRVTILAGQVVNGDGNGVVYDMRQVSRSRTLARRVIDPIWHRIAPYSAFRSAIQRSLLTVTRRALAEQAIQVIDMEESFGWARSICQATSIPVCVRLHGPWFLNGSALGVPDDAEYRARVRAEGEAIQLAHAISAPSRNVLEQVRNFYGCDLPDAEVIPAPTSPVPEAERWRLEDCDRKRVLFIGRFDRHKGGDLVIEAFKQVLEAIPDARLRFVGPDEGCRTNDGRIWHIEEFIRDRIPGALETGRVEWLGPVPFPLLAKHRREAMVTVVCSRYENCPLTVVEAMALGCPTVAANTGGIPEILQDGVHGLLHRSDDPSDIAAKIIQLAQNPTQAAGLGHQAALDCERHLYPEPVARRFVELYLRAISRVARP
jgi:glycosyltransferase involved in cell wall biosynthesis